MSKVVKLPYFTVSANDLANWLDAQPNLWWTVDGDPYLTSRVDFPCPSNELSAELRQANKMLRIYDPREHSPAHGDLIPSTQLNELADTDNNSQVRTFLFCWDQEAIQWLLAEAPQASA